VRRVQPVMQEAGKPKLEKAEHRQRQHDEDQRKCAQYPGILQRCCEQAAGPCGRHARNGVGQGHAST